MEKFTILKSLVGSRAHGLSTPESDYDYKSVYVLPTKEILSLGFQYASATKNISGNDDTEYEIGHFLKLCTKANPSILEVLLSNEAFCNTHYANEMRELFPYMFDPKDAFNAYMGYSNQQMKQFLSGNLNIADRRRKFAVAYIRNMHHLIQLLQTGTFSVYIKDDELREYLRIVKGGDFDDNEVISRGKELEELAKTLVDGAKNYKDLDKINNFLYKVRKDFLE